MLIDVLVEINHFILLDLSVDVAFWLKFFFFLLNRKVQLSYDFSIRLWVHRISPFIKFLLKICHLLFKSLDFAPHFACLSLKICILDTQLFLFFFLIEIVYFSWTYDVCLRVFQIIEARNSWDSWGVAHVTGVWRCIPTVEWAYTIPAAHWKTALSWIVLRWRCLSWLLDWRIDLSLSSCRYCRSRFAAQIIWGGHFVGILFVDLALDLKSHTYRFGWTKICAIAESNLDIFLVRIHMSRQIQCRFVRILFIKLGTFLCKFKGA